MSKTPWTDEYQKLLEVKRPLANLGMDEFGKVFRKLTPRELNELHDVNVRIEKWEALRESAPALLDALLDTLTIVLSRGMKLGLDDKGPVIEKARAIIASAQGRKLHGKIKHIIC